MYAPPLFRKASKALPAETLLSMIDYACSIAHESVVNGVSPSDIDDDCCRAVHAGLVAVRVVDAEAKLKAVIAAADKMEKILLDKHLLDGIEAAREYRVALELP